MATQADGVADKAQSDLARLWEAAVEDHEKATGQSLRLEGLKNMQDVMNGTEGLSVKFKAFRDDGSKLSKVRTALKNNMWLIENIVHAVQNVGNATSAFPPVMPANLIFAAFGQIMKSFADVSADYDHVMGFFDFTHRFFDRLCMIEQRIPDMPEFQRCVTYVFSSILSICSIATRYTVRKRLKKWFENLLQGSDEELATASKQLEGAVNELSQAVGLTTFKMVDQLNEVLRSMSGHVEFLVSSVTLIDERTAAMQTNQQIMMDMQQETLAKMGDHSQMLNDVVGYFEQIEITPKQPQAPPEPVSTVPFARDPAFIDRGTLLDEILDRLPESSSGGGSAKSSSMALVGLGGVGKSQLVIECSYRIRERPSRPWVFWVYASNTTRFEESYCEIAERAKIGGHDDPKTNKFKIVCDWLRDPKNGSWVLILDNLDDESLLDAPVLVSQEGQTDDDFPQRLLSFLPRCQHGSLIITTRNKHAALRIVDDDDVIGVNPMDESQAFALMERKLGMQAAIEDIAKLVEALEFIPLAIVQSAAYIRKRAPRYSVRQYLEGFQKSDHKKARLLNHAAGHLQRDWDAKSTILITWQISFDHIQETRPSAAALLSLMSFFDRQGIPEELLHDKKSHEDSDESDDEDSTIDSESDDEFEEDIMTLRDYSLISISEDGEVFEMHRLVQVSMRIWLETRGEIEHWKEQFIEKLVGGFPYHAYEDLGKCQLLFPHVQAAMSQRPSLRKPLTQWIRLLEKAATYALQKGNTTDAKALADESVKASKETFGEAHPETLHSIGTLATTLQAMGQDHKAKELEVQMLESSKSMFGVEHHTTLNIMGNLGSTLNTLRQFHEAKELEEQVLESSKKVLGEEHPDTLAAMGNLAATLKELGHLEKARVLEMQALESSRRTLGKDHPETLTTMSNVSLTLLGLDQLQEAKELANQALESRKRVLGEGHIDTLRSMVRVALVWRSLNRKSDALHLMRDCLARRKQVLGPNHPLVLSTAEALLNWEGEGSEESKEYEDEAI